MLFDLIRAFFAAILVGVLPGWFWARCMLSSGDRAAQLVYSVALSMTLVPVAALLQARLLGGGITLAVAVVSVLAVFGMGLGAYLRFGPPKGTDEPLAPRPFPLGVPSLVPLLPALGLVLAAVYGVLPVERVALPVALLLLLAGLARLVEAAPETEHPGREASGGPRRTQAVPVARRLLLPAVLALVLVRGYLGPVLHDWPLIRGVDRFTQAIMTNLALSGGSIESYMVYPPGFHALMAAISRLSGLGPLEVFPVLAPAFLLLPALALYALAYRLWGWEVGVAAALFSGLILGSSYQYLIEARYPQLLSAQFLTVLTVAALFRLYESPSTRDGLMLALLGSSVVLYHHVGSFFLALLLALVAALVLPGLLIYRPREGIALLGSLTLLFFLSVLYAWDTYDLGQTVAGLLGGSDAGATGAAVTGVIGTQQPYDLAHLLETASQPVVWLGVLGAILLVTDRRRGAPYAFARATFLVWATVMFVGSRTALSGFPERFERDLGVPLALFAAFALVAVLRSLRLRGPVARPVAAVAVALAVLLVGLQARQNLEEAGRPAPRKPSATARISMTPAVAAAGEWLEENNAGGNIIVTPYLNQVPSRAMLAMGGYSAVQTFTKERIERNRDLPPSGQGPPRDAFQVMEYPGSERARRILEEYDVRYVVLYKRYPGVEWQDFEELPNLYRKTFENEDVVIHAPRETG